MAVGDFRFSLLLLSFTAAVAATSSDDRRKALSEAGPKEETSRGMFAPRMYYDEWTPLGRGDPLKNDPTFDYVPPVLEHVHYWKEPRSPSTDPPVPVSINARRDPPDLMDEVVQAPHPSNLFQNMPDIPATMLVPPPPPPRIETSNVQPTRVAPTTVIDVEPVNMILHSSTTISWLDFKNPVATMPPGSPVAWKGSNTPIIEPSPLPTMTHSSASPFQLQRYRDEVKERPFSPNSIFHKNGDDPVSNLGHKPHFPVAKNNPPLSLSPVVKPAIPIQQGQPFRLPQANPVPVKPIITADDTESYASILQSLLDDVPTTTERIVSTMPPPVATTTPSPMTTDHIFSHYKQPAIPVTAPLYLIIQGHSKVKTYGASKSPILEIPHNEVLKDNKSKNRYSRDAGTSYDDGRDVRQSESEGKT